MSSRFVSAGAIDPTTGEAAAATAGAAAAAAGENVPTSSDADRDSRKPDNDEWLAVEKELAAERRRREEARKPAAGAERSLFEVLQANKEAKQAAFEEANRIKNQFRALDDDEIEFLDDVKARQREEEGRLRRETEERVEAFRAAQRRKERGEGEGKGDEEPAEGEWAAGRKRKRVAKGVGLLKRRTTTGEGEGREVKGTGKEEKQEQRPDLAKEAEKKTEETKGTVAAAPVAKPKMGLVSYDSDDD